MAPIYLVIFGVLAFSAGAADLPETRTAEEELEMRTALENEELFEGDIVQDSLFLNAMPHKWKSG